MLERIDHVGIVVDNLSEARAFLEALGLQHDRNLEIPGRLMASFFRCGEIDIEVLEIYEPTERARRLGPERARIEHIAVQVDSIVATVDRLRGLGIKTQTSFPVRLDKGLNYWTVADTCDGVVYQLVEPELQLDSQGSNGTG